MTEIRLPSLGADMDAATIVRWSVAPGDRVAKGESIGEIETDKGVFDLDSREAGVVAELLVPEGAKVAVGTPIVRLASTAATEADAPGPPAAGRVRASPLARRIAAEHAIDLAAVTGTGLHGAITRADVERAVLPAGGALAVGGPAQPDRPPEPSPEAPSLEAPSPEAPSPEVPRAEVPSPVVASSPVETMRRAIATAVSRSKREIPHYYLEHDVELRAALAWLAARNARHPVTERILPATLLVQATARALARFPDFNGLHADGRFTSSPAAHVAIITALRGGGLVAPVIHDAGALSLDALNAALLDLVDRTRRGALRTSELSGGTISITNLGDRGVRAVHGVIYPPQVAIVGFGAITERPWAQDGMLAVRPVVTVTLAADHRVSDGMRGARFLAEIGRQLQTPEAP